MRRYVLHQLPKEPKTYISILFASLLTIVAVYIFIQIGEYIQLTFKVFTTDKAYISYFITPVIFALIVFVDKKYFNFSGGSGIPQLIAANDSRNRTIRSMLLSIKIALVKMCLVFLAMLGGASISFGGPSVHIGGSIFYHLATLIKLKRKLMIHSVIAIGGSAGLIVAFNAPLAGFLFAYEEIGRSLKKQALILISISCGSIYLFFNYFFSSDLYLIDLSQYTFELMHIWQLFPLAILGGVLGGIFAKIALILLSKFMFGGTSKIIAIAFIMGLIVASSNYLSDSLIAGTGQRETIMLLTGDKLGIEFVVLKYLSTLASFLSTIAGGIFMTSISIGASIGSEVSYLYSQVSPQIVMIMAMIAYLSGVIRAPLTSSFLVLEMTNSLNLLLPAIIVAFIANMTSKQISNKPIYESIAHNYLQLTKIK